MSDGKKNGVDRRTFLKAAGLAGASCFLPSLSSQFGGPSIAHAASSTGAPRRVIFLLCELGWNPYEFRMKPPGAPDDVLLPSAYHPDYENAKDERSWDFYLKDVPREQFSPILKPLYDLREYTTAIDGLGMLSIGLDKYGDGHARGMLHALSGHPAAAPITHQKSMGAVPSIDQRIAEYLRANNENLSDLTSLHVMLTKWWQGQPDDGGFHQYVYASAPDGARKVPPVTNPNDLYQRLFGRGVASGPVGDAQGAVLDALEQRYSTMEGRVGTQDRNKIKQHQQRIVDIQDRLRLLEEAACEDPGEPTTSDDMWYQANRESIFNLIVSAMACDITRVATIRMTNHAYVDRFDAGDHNFHEYYSHGTWPQAKWLEGGEKKTKWDNANMVLANKNRVQVEYMAELAETLKDTPDVDGNNMLDNTLIVLMEEISHGGHGHDQWPVVMCGGFGGAIRPGRYIRLPRVYPKPGRVSGMGQYAGKPHSHLLISIAQSMGVPLEHLGVKSVRGRANGKNHSISLSGPLHELT